MTTTAKPGAITTGTFVPPTYPTSVKFATAGMGGILGWIGIHPFNTLAIRMNLATTSSTTAAPTSFTTFASQLVKKEGISALYNGLGAGITRQIFYATSRFGLFEVFRDKLAQYRETDLLSRLITGCSSGGCAALLSCPAEVSLVRMSNDSALPLDKRRNYTSIVNCATRIAREEGFKAFYRGSMPFVNRAMLVGACQVGTYDQFRNSYRKMGITHKIFNVFCSAMSAGLIYSTITMPFETAKNRMAFQTADAQGNLLYKSTIQTITHIAKTEGVLSLWNGFPFYFGRCGGHTVLMFIFVEELRSQYTRWAQ